METTVILGPVKRALERSKGRWPIIASKSGVAVSSVRKIAQGVWRDPGVLAIEQLYLYFQDHEPDLLRQEESRVQ